MRVIFLGDIVGKAGRKIIAKELNIIRNKYNIDFVIANAENAAGGFGVTENIIKELTSAGIDAFTLGNHSWDQRETIFFIDKKENLLRPINYPKKTPGKGINVFNIKGKKIVVINAMGRLFMDPLDDPFDAITECLNKHMIGRNCHGIIIDFHAEATSEKMAMGHFIDGKASMIVGTHTHVPTADYHIMNGGTAYLSDAGMCGDYDSVIGMEKSEPINRFVNKISSKRMSPATGDATMCGVTVDIDTNTGKAINISPIRIGGKLSNIIPNYW